MNPEKEGFLTKEGRFWLQMGSPNISGHVLKNWKKRWFVLKNDTLYYFPNANVCISIGRAIDVFQCDRLAGCIRLVGMMVKKAPERSKKFCFVIKPLPNSGFARDSGKVYFLVAESEYVFLSL